MRRHPALAKLSRDHHQALAVALRLRQATAETSADARVAFLAFWREGGAVHFDVEEEVLLPALGDHALCDRIRAEHDAIRADAAALAADEAVPAAPLARVGEALAAHVRLEERELFPLLERALDDAAMWQIAADVEASETRRARSPEHAGNPQSARGEIPIRRRDASYGGGTASLPSNELG